jgi:hypothetical protein
MARLLRPVRVAPLASRMALHNYAISPRDAPEFLQKSLALDERAQRYPKRGAGATLRRERGKPGARCTRSRVREV